MSNNKISLCLGYTKDWLGHIKKCNTDKYNWLLSFDNNKLKSIIKAAEVIYTILDKVESLSLQEGFNSKINKLNLFDSHKNNQGEILKDNLYKLRDKPLSIKWSFIQKLIILDKELLK